MFFSRRGIVLCLIYKPFGIDIFYVASGGGQSTLFFFYTD